MQLPQVYKIYREMLWLRKQSGSSQQASTKWRKRGSTNKSNPASLVISNSSSTDTNELNRSINPPQQNTYGPATFALDPNPVTQKHNIEDDSNNCIIFTNVELVNQTATTTL